MDQTTIKKPTDKEKIQMYEQFLHNLQMYSFCGRGDLIEILLNNACNWSYAHRAGNGELSEEEQDAAIHRKFWKLTTVPDVAK